MKRPKKRIIAVLVALSIIFSGLIIAKEKITNFTGRGIDKRAKIEDCNPLGQPEKTKCWVEIVDEVLEEEGLDSAFEVVALLYEEDPSFSANCHDFVHVLGEEVYSLFYSGEEFDVSSKSSFCAYGFYHGFMQLLVSKRGDIKLARDFCKYVDDQLAAKTSGASLACYHGIGHGWTNVHDESLWGDERAMVYPALKLCEEVSETEHKLEICATGVFDSISIGYYNQAYGLEMRKDDPLWLCWEQEERFKRACYMDMMPAILWLGDYDLAKALEYMEYVEPDYLEISVETVAENSVRFMLRENKDPLESIDLCRDLGENLHLACSRGLASGVMQFGPPQEEYVGALEFCKSEVLVEEEKELCFERVLRYSQALYPREKVEEICRMAGEEYQKYCLSG